MSALMWSDPQLGKKLRALGVPKDTVWHILTEVQRDVPNIVQLQTPDGRTIQVALIEP
jgi:hypothetical protein